MNMTSLFANSFMHYCIYSVVATAQHFIFGARAPWAPGDRLPGIWGRTPFLLHPENPTYAAVRVIIEVSCRRNIAHNTLSTRLLTSTADKAQSTLIRSWKYLKHSAAIGGMVGHMSRTRPPYSRDFLSVGKHNFTNRTADNRNELPDDRAT